jgi:hypothetical protein
VIAETRTSEEKWKVILNLILTSGLAAWRQQETSKGACLNRVTLRIDMRKIRRAGLLTMGPDYNATGGSSARLAVLPPPKWYL